MVLPGHPFVHIIHLFRELKSQQSRNEHPGSWLRKTLFGDESELAALCFLCMCRSCWTIIWSRKTWTWKAKSSTRRWRETTTATWRRWLMKRKRRVSQRSYNFAKNVCVCLMKRTKQKHHNWSLVTIFITMIRKKKEKNYFDVSPTPAVASQNFCGQCLCSHNISQSLPNQSTNSLTRLRAFLVSLIVSAVLRGKVSFYLHFERKSWNLIQGCNLLVNSLTIDWL